MGIILLGTGSSMPQRIVDNIEMESIVETTDEWIRERTGIHQRHIATTETSLELSCTASINALKDIDYSEIDLVVLATATPDKLFPSMACEVKRILGLDNAIAFDISIACSGFVYALWIAEGIMKSNSFKKALIIGSERMSRIIDWNDRTTCVIFGDGAGAAVFENNDSKKGILGMHMQNYDDVNNSLYCYSQFAETPFSDEKPKPPHIVMDGQQVFKFSVRACPEVMEKALDKAGVSAEEIKYVVPHQANMRIISAISKRFDIPFEKFIMTVHETGNTSAASVPIALDHLMRTYDVIKGDKIMLIGFGGGFSAGAVVIEI